MRLAYFDCIGGIAGDMVLAALVDCGADAQILFDLPKTLNLENSVSIKIEDAVQGHIRGKHIKVFEKDSASLTSDELVDIVQRANLGVKAKSVALKVLNTLIAAEALAHGIKISHIHLNELGGLDTLVDVCGVGALLENLEVDTIYCSKLPYPTGPSADGGLLTAPATLKIISTNNIPMFESHGSWEMVTPTGAAIASLASGFAMPEFTPTRIGHGFGSFRHKTYPNVLRVIIGNPLPTLGDIVCQIEFFVDDMTGEQLGAFVSDVLNEGALDVHVIPATSKKSRPSFLVIIITPLGLEQAIAEFALEHATTLGLRMQHVNRVVAERSHVLVETQYGPIRVKIKKAVGKIISAHPEFEDCYKAALEYNVPLQEVQNAALSIVKKKTLGERS
jgi:uncharacterized protein (TIGR00299 family) protein